MPNKGRTLRNQSVEVSTNLRFRDCVMKHFNHWVFVNEKFRAEKRTAKQTAALKNRSVAWIAIKSLRKVHHAQGKGMFIDRLSNSKIHQPHNPFFSHHTIPLTITMIMTVTLTMVIWQFRNVANSTESGCTWRQTVNMFMSWTPTRPASQQQQTNEANVMRAFLVLRAQCYNWCRLPINVL